RTPQMPIRWLRVPLQKRLPVSWYGPRRHLAEARYQRRGPARLVRRRPRVPIEWPQPLLRTRASARHLRVARRCRRARLGPWAAASSRLAEGAGGAAVTGSPARASRAETAVEPGPWAAYPAGPSFLSALVARRAPRAVWSALPGVEWAPAVARAAQATLSGGRG